MHRRWLRVRRQDVRNFCGESEEREQQVFKANLLMQTYGRSGSVKDAHSVFENMHVRNVFSWNIMLAAYAANGDLLLAKEFFDEMPTRNAVSWNTVLGGYSKIADLQSAVNLSRRMPAWDAFATNIVIAAYSRNGQLQKSRFIFDSMISRDVVSWNTIVKSFCHAGLLEEAIFMFERMSNHNPVVATAMISAFSDHSQLGRAIATFGDMFHRNIFAWNAMIQAFFASGDFSSGSWLFEISPQHDLVSWNALLATTSSQHNALRSIFHRMPQRDVVSWTTFLHCLAREGFLDDANAAFERAPETNILSWTVMIAANAQWGCFHHAKALFDATPSKDIISWNTIASAYVQVGQLENANLALSVSPSLNSASWNILIEAFAQRGLMKAAKRLFDSMPQRDVVSWNSLIAGYSQTSYVDTFATFALMDLEGGVKPDKVTYLNMLEACANLPADPTLVKVVRDSISCSRYKFDPSVANSMINMYGKCGDIAEALEVFRNSPDRGVISWSSVIAAFTGQLCQARRFFQTMQFEGVRPNLVTYVSMLEACANAANLTEGKALHLRIMKDSNLVADFSNESKLSNAIINMYNKCGRVEDSLAVFNAMRNKDLISWSSCISGLASNGFPSESIQAFQGMLLEGVYPNDVTMLSILSACSHAGLVDLGKHFFTFMVDEEPIKLASLRRQYACMVDLLSRAGRLSEAEELTTSMPFEAEFSSWMSLLASSKEQGDLLHGLQAAKAARICH